MVIYDQAKENPTTECVADCVELARREGIDFIVGLGGGSSMDTAKGCTSCSPMAADEGLLGRW